MKAYQPVYNNGEIGLSSERKSDVIYTNREEAVKELNERGYYYAHTLESNDTETTRDIYEPEVKEVETEDVDFRYAYIEEVEIQGTL